MSSPVEVSLAQCTPCQRRAVDHVRDRALQTHAADVARIAAMLRHVSLPADAWRGAVDGLLRHARIVLHFHPDRVTNDGRTVARRLRDEGVYRSQFETGISNGSPTAFPGGERDEWERQLFGGAYHAPGVRPDERPKYGALQIFHYGDGPSPRFGSCYFVLRQHVTPRTTFTYGDSHLKPDRLGTIDAFQSIMAAWLHDVAATGTALGTAALTVAGLIHYLTGRHPWPVRSVYDLHTPVLSSSVTEAAPGTATPGHASSDGSEPRGTITYFQQAEQDVASRTVGRILDDYIEAQVHGPVHLHTDAAKLVADPSFRSTETGGHLVEISRHYNVPLQWHRGFTLSPRSVPTDFRGPVMVPLAKRIAEVIGGIGSPGIDTTAIGAVIHDRTTRYATSSGTAHPDAVTLDAFTLDAATLGAAAAHAARDPSSWRMFGSDDEVLRRFRQMWHVLVRFGTDAPS